MMEFSTQERPLLSRVIAAMKRTGMHPAVAQRMRRLDRAVGKTSSHDVETIADYGDAVEEARARSARARGRR